MHNPTSSQNELGTLMEIDLTLDMEPVLKQPSRRPGPIIGECDSSSLESSSNLPEETTATESGLGFDTMDSEWSFEFGNEPIPRPAEPEPGSAPDRGWQDVSCTTCMCSLFCCGDGMTKEEDSSRMDCELPA